MKKISVLLWLAAITISIAAASPGRAEEIYLLGGVMQNTDEGEGSYSWQLEYLEGLGEHFAASLSYLNEGHVPTHHRDGNTLQLWTRTNLFDRRLSLAAGIGPYFYFDTTAATEGASFSNNHGWKAMASLAATWYTESRWLFQVRANWVTAGSSIDTLSAVAGIGYQLDIPPSPGPIPKEPVQVKKTTGNEVTLLVGRTIVNSFSSEHSGALSIEYRRGLWRYVDWTIGWLYEGDNRLIRRDGITTQFWGVREFLDDRVMLGVGGGAYVAIDHYSTSEQGDKTSKGLSGIVTLTASYRFAPHWDLRSSWNRIVTDYDRDTDVILGGVGYRF